MKKFSVTRSCKWIAAAMGLYGIMACAQAAPVDVQVLSATVKDQKIGDAKVTLQKNGEQSIIATTNAAGRVVLAATFADDPAAMLIIKKAGYSNLMVKCPCNGMTYAISPVMHRLDEMRIVLNWGAEPENLDSHLFYQRDHIFFLQKYGTDAQLDVENDTSYGPETITIKRRHDGVQYIYAVDDYSDKDRVNTQKLSLSGAKVFVYIGQTLIKTYYVPKNQRGNLWAVFAVSGDGELQDINTFTGVNTFNRAVRLSDLGSPNGKSQVITQSARYSAAYHDQAVRLNKLGENAYHAYKYDLAMQLYENAIYVDGNYGQAYSNLGLVCQKVGRVAEALWANRKAIALATGPTAATVRASSHYNNGRIYEAASQWSDALREYQRAQSEKPGQAYTKAIKRMQRKGAH